MEEDELTEAEFTRRFKARMLLRAHPRTHFDPDEDGPGESIADYAEHTAPTYFEEGWLSKEGPEACADSDMSYWGE